MGIYQAESNINGWKEQLCQERETIAQLAKKAQLGRERRCDIHLCYGDFPEVVFKGFLVTWRENINRLVAYCPINARHMRDSSQRPAELKRTFASVTRIALSPETAGRSAEILWLGLVGEIDRPIPGWVYGLRCLPLGGEWNGEFKSPKPFCPELFEQMARQPQAIRWLARQQTFVSARSPQAVIENPILPIRIHQVLTCLKSGYSEKEIANELGISKHTIHDHVKRVYRRFGVHSRAELLSLFVQ